MGPHQVLRTALLLSSLALLPGCAVVIRSQPSPTPVLPAVEYQVRLAQQAGPGFLDDCPVSPGQSKMRFAVDLPGQPTIPGWCRTSVNRRADADIVTFAAHWDGRTLLHRQDTFKLAYLVPRNTTPTTRGSPAQLIKQHGTPPP